MLLLLNWKKSLKQESKLFWKNVPLQSGGRVYAQGFRIRCLTNTCGFHNCMAMYFFCLGLFMQFSVLLLCCLQSLNISSFFFFLTLMFINSSPTLEYSTDSRQTPCDGVKVGLGTNPRWRVRVTVGFGQTPCDITHRFL